MKSICDYARSLELSGIDELLLPAPPRARLTAHGEPAAALCLIYQRCSSAEMELLTKMLSAINVNISSTYRLSFDYCEDQAPDQIQDALAQSHCRPAVIVPLGPEAMAECLPFNGKYDHIRNTTYRLHGCPVIAVDHPQALTANPELKKRSWASLQAVEKILNEQR